MCYPPAGVCEQHAADVLAHKRHSAQRLLQIGQACQARGDHAMARSCFDEVMRLCPGSEYAQAAGVRMGEMRVAMQSQPRGLGGAEAQELPDLIHETRADLQRIQEAKPI